MTFDPSRFGVKKIEKAGHGEAVHGCYLRLSKTGERSMALEIVMDKEATDFVMSKFGDRVDAGFDEKGRVFVWRPDGAGRKLSQRAKGSAKTSVSLASATKDYMDLMGTFRRLYVSWDAYAGGEAVVFTPTGERDMR